MSPRCSWCNAEIPEAPDLSNRAQPPAPLPDGLKGRQRDPDLIIDLVPVAIELRADRSQDANHLVGLPGETDALPHTPGRPQ